MAHPGHINGSPASRRSTPSKGTPNGSRRVNGFHSPFRDSLHGSPAAQVLEDYGRVYASKERALKRSLDEQTTEQAAKHFKALDDGLREHHRIRESAERELELIRLENERERLRKAELERLRVDEARRKLEQQRHDEQRRQAEDERAREQEQERRRQEELKKQQDECAKNRAAAQQRRDEEEAARKQQREKEEADRKAREDAEAKQRQQQAEKEKEAAAQQAAQPAPQPGGAGPSGHPARPAAGQQAARYPAGFVSAPNEVEETHKKYLELHQRLKKMRQEVTDQVKAKGMEHKAQLTEWRQSIKRAVGMLKKLDDPETKRSNADRLKFVTGVLDTAARTTEPMIDVTQFIVENRQPPDAPKEGPAQLLFLLHHFAKCIIRQILAEVSLDPAYGNAIGIMAVTVFARPNYLFNGQSLIDIFWAKYHKRCPALFGISGNEQTVQGRMRIGWHRKDDELPPDQYYLAIRGLGIGFANITLRSFAKSSNKNPAPNSMFWQAMARVLNTAPDQVQPTHFELLKAILEHCTPKMISIFGDAAVALIRNAVTTFPERHEASLKTPSAKSSAIALKSLPHILQQKYQLQL